MTKRKIGMFVGFLPAAGVLLSSVGAFADMPMRLRDPWAFHVEVKRIVREVEETAGADKVTEAMLQEAINNSPVLTESRDKMDAYHSVSAELSQKRFGRYRYKRQLQ